ncbi:MAG: hypothetical protein LRS43_00485, partial [Desulfurococcales archaeon]|nr:hypothetical protein [Desulfurococcales archaeon]
PSASVEVVEYFTSGGVSVVDASIGWSGSGLTVLALDSTGSLYFYKVPQRYWSVIGPSVGDEALSGIGDTVVSWFEPVTRLEGWALYSVNASRVLVNPSRYPDEVFSNLSITFYYNKTGLPAPAVPGVEEDPLYLRVKTLVYALVLPGANAAYLVERVESGNTSTFSLERIHASQYVIHGFFEESVIDKSTGNVVSSVCYYSNETVALSPGRDLEVLLLLQPLAGSLEECYSITGVDPSKINRASIDTLLVVDTLEVPADISLGSQTRLVQIPYPVEPSIGVQSIDQPALKLLVEPSSVPEGWPAQASYMLLIGVGKALLIYLLNSSLNVLDFPGTTEYGFLEVVALESTPSSIVVSPDASRIYVGTSNGRLVELSWVLDEQSGIARYIATRSLQVAAAQVSSLALLPGGKFLLTTAVDGSIQLVDLASWRPLWRGIKGFPSIQLNLDSLEIAYADQSKAVYFSGEGFMAVFYHDLRKYVPLEVRLDVTVKSLNGGSYSIEVPGSRAYILDPGGNAVAQAVIGEEAFFAPEGEHRLLVELPGFGSVEYADVRVSFPSTVYTASIVLREVEVYAFTPAESDVESGKYANLLLSGPRPGASVTALPLGQSQVLGYTVYPTASSSVTGENGTVTLILWDGVSYDITASLAHFREGRGSTGFFDPERVELEMQPELYSTTISVVDSEA